MDPILTSDLLIEAGDDYVLRPAPASYAVAILSFLALFVDVPCIAWHIKNRNFSAISLVFWIMLGNLFNFVNAIVWANDDVDHWFQGQVYCDVEVKLDLGATIGITGALLCLMRSLARALDTDKPAILQNKPHGQRKLIVEGILCFGLPVYLMAIHYVVQPNRYYIFGIAGCTVSFDRSWPAIVLVFIWPVLICLMDSYYCGKIFSPTTESTDSVSSSHHHPSPQISTQLCLCASFHVERSHQSPFPPPFLCLGHSTARLPTSANLRLVRQHGCASTALRLERRPRSNLLAISHSPACQRHRPLRSLDPHCPSLYRLRMLRPWSRGPEHVSLVGYICGIGKADVKTLNAIERFVVTGLRAQAGCEEYRQHHGA